MAASWLRISELSDTYADLVCTVGRVQSINSLQRTLIICDADEDSMSSSATVHISLVYLRTSFDLQSLAASIGQCVQVYGKVIRKGSSLLRIDAQLIRKLSNEFDLNEYGQGLIVTRNYMDHVDSNGVEYEGLADNSGNPIRTILLLASRISPCRLCSNTTAYGEKYDRSRFHIRNSYRASVLPRIAP